MSVNMQPEDESQEAFLHLSSDVQVTSSYTQSINYVSYFVFNRKHKTVPPLSELQ